MRGAILVLLLSVATVAKEAEVQYFPDLALDEKAESHQFIVEWYSEHLRTMEEPSLLDAGNDINSHTYRFLWLRTFDHPIALRVQVRPEGDGVLVVRVLDGAGGYKPGKVMIRRTVELDPNKVSSILEGLERIGFWELPGRDTTSASGRDGAQWVLEGVRDGRYHVVDRWTPKGGPYRDLCLMLLRFSGLEVDKIY